MPNIYRGSQIIAKRYRGSVPITKAYRGTKLIWSLSDIRDDFNRPNSTDLKTSATTSDWHHMPVDEYEIGVMSQQARISLPEGKISYDFITRRTRWDGLLGSNDGYIECRCGSLGANRYDHITGEWRYNTDLLARATNGLWTEGIGIRLESSDCYLYKSVVSGSKVVETRLLEGGPFQVGDSFRMKFKGDLFSLYRNGRFLGEINDPWPADASHQSIVMRMDASKETLGARRFSPTLDWIEAAPTS